jgi:hypothetical protein
MIPAAGVWAEGSRGSRSDSAAARPDPHRPEPSPPPVIVPRAPSARGVGGGTGTLARVAAGALVASLLVGGVGHDLGGRDAGYLLLGSLGIVLFVMFLRRRQQALVPPTRVAVGSPTGSGLDRGVRDIRQLDPGFDPMRLAGYTGMVFRDAQRAWTTRDIGSLRDRVTPEMYGALEAQCDRLQSARRANRVEEIEISAEITEAWQERGQDYVTAYIRGSIVDYTVDEVSGALVDGSRTMPKGVEEFWTFTRPAGLNFWMLSGIQTS